MLVVQKYFLSFIFRLVIFIFRHELYLLWEACFLNKMKSPSHLIICCLILAQSCVFCLPLSLTSIQRKLLYSPMALRHVHLIFSPSSFRIKNTFPKFFSCLIRIDFIVNLNQIVEVLFPHSPSLSTPPPPKLKGFLLSCFILVFIQGSLCNRLLCF